MALTARLVAALGAAAVLVAACSTGPDSAASPEAPADAASPVPTAPAPREPAPRGTVTAVDGTSTFDPEDRDLATAARGALTPVDGYELKATDEQLASAMDDLTLPVLDRAYGRDDVGAVLVREIRVDLVRHGFVVVHAVSADLADAAASERAASSMALALAQLPGLDTPGEEVGGETVYRVENRELEADVVSWSPGARLVVSVVTFDRSVLDAVVTGLLAA